MSIEAAIAKAEEQWEFAGTDQLGFDSYVHNILNAFVGDRVLYVYSGSESQVARGQLAIMKDNGSLVQVFPEEST